jgi:hypothetical protein
MNFLFIDVLSICLTFTLCCSVLTFIFFNILLSVSCSVKCLHFLLSSVLDGFASDQIFHTGILFIIIIYLLF